jgi:hypothetical protein
MDTWRQTSKDHAISSNAMLGTCIKCALTRHNFTQATASPVCEDGLAEALFAHAWIDGRPHALWPSAGIQRMFCRECGRRTESLYVPSPL